MNITRNGFLKRSVGLVAGVLGLSAWTPEVAPGPEVVEIKAEVTVPGGEADGTTYTAYMQVTPDVLRNGTVSIRDAVDMAGAALECEVSLEPGE